MLCIILFVTKVFQVKWSSLHKYTLWECHLACEEAICAHLLCKNKNPYGLKIKPNKYYNANICSGDKMAWAQKEMFLREREALDAPHLKRIKTKQPTPTNRALVLMNRLDLGLLIPHRSAASSPHIWAAGWSLPSIRGTQRLQKSRNAANPKAPPQQPKSRISWSIWASWNKLRSRQPRSLRRCKTCFDWPIRALSCQSNWRLANIQKCWRWVFCMWKAWQPGLWLE